MFRNINIKHPWIVGAMNLLLVMVVYTLTRLFFYWINIDLYPNVSTCHLIEMLIGGLRFDLTALLYINSLYLLLVLLPLPATIRSHKAYMGVAKWTFWIPNIIGFIANCMDIVYVRFTNRRTTCTIFSEFQNDDNIIQVILQSALQYWHVTVFGIVILIIFIIFFLRIHIEFDKSHFLCLCLTLNINLEASKTSCKSGVLSFTSDCK